MYSASICQNLHGCKYQLLGPAPCRNGTSCKFGHQLRTAHNGALLQRFLLTELSDADVGLLIRLCGSRSAPGCSTRGSTKTSSVPRICPHYNRAGCRNSPPSSSSSSGSAIIIIRFASARTCTSASTT